MIALIFLMFLFYVLCELVIVNFLYTFAVIDYPGLNLSKLSGTHLYSVFSSAFLIGQFFAVICSFKISFAKILAIDNFGMTLGGVTLAFLPLYRHEAPVLLWVGVGIIGMFGASIYGTTFVWAETYITINATAAAIFSVGAALGEMFLTIPVGLTIEKSPLSFLFILVSYVLATTLNFIITWRFALSKGEGNSIRRT